jgi:phosphoribosylanthranilate isomerase
VFVKICGITNEEDALLAVAMGADAVGFVFAPSPRQIAVSQVRDITRRLPPEVMTLGLFRDEASRRVVEMVNAAGLHGVQLHGHETPAEGKWIRQRVQFLIQAFAAGDRMLERVEEYQAADAVLIDSPTPGSGQVFDWVLAEGLPLDRRVILAGGLTPENVGEAIARVRPWGVDVSSGVEREPGRKDVSKLMRFVNAAKQAGIDVGEETVDLDAPLATDAGADGDGSDGAEPDTDEGSAFYDWEDDRSAG